jgi:Zn-dependent oligopeptidase
MNTNPLLDFSSLPRFDAIQPEHVAPAINELLSRYQALIDELIARPKRRPGTASPRRSPTWANSSAAPGAWSVTCTA